MNIRDDFVIKNINEGYLVGGSVRDFIMGKPFIDRDIAVRGAEKYSRELADKLDATFIELDSENKIYRLVLKDKINYLDISELRGNSIEDDLKERDFTINAIAYDLKTDKIIDIVNGKTDIENKIIRAIKYKNFDDDPLRLLRAFRFMAVTGFEIESKTLEYIKEKANLLLNPSKERIHDEILKLFGGKYASKTLLTMLDCGILEIIFPFVKEMKLVPSNSHHHLDLIYHVIETVNQTEKQYEGASLQVKEHLNTVDFGGYPRINHLKLAAFMHDIGKYSTWTVEDNGKTIWKLSDGFPYPDSSNLRHRFIKHDFEGAKQAEIFLKSLKFSNKQINYISDMIRNHIYPSSVISSPNLDKKVMMRYVRKMENNAIDNIILAKADRLSAQGVAVTQKMTEDNINGLNKLLNFYLDVKDTLKPLPVLLNGNEIMEILKLKPSPKLGNVISALHEAQLNGEVNTKEEALSFIKQNANI